MKSEVERNGIMKIIAKRELEIEWSKIRVTALSQKWQLALFGLSNILIFALPFNTIYQSPYSGTGLFFDYASQILSGQLPYRDFAIEYPPLSMLFFLLPRLIASNPDSYAIAFGAETLLFSLLSLFLVVLLSRRLGLVPWKSLTIYTLALLAIGPIISRQYDIFPAVTVLLALYAFMSGKHKTSWALLAIATLTKIYPIVFVPILLLHHIRNRQHRHIRLGIITFATTILAIVIPFLIISPGGLLASFSYHAQRGIQLESIYSSILLLGSKSGWLAVEPEFGFGSWNLVGPVADTIAKVSLVLLPLSLVATYWFIYRRMKRTPNPVNEIVSYSLLVVAVLIATSKVLSPQYLIWLCPLIPLFSGRFQYALWAVFIAISALTYYIFPLHYFELIDLKSGVTAALLARNVLVIAMVILVAISLAQRKRGISSEMALQNILEEKQ